MDSSARASRDAAPNGRPDTQSFAGEADAALLVAIKAYCAAPPNFAKADKRGKFPMAALKRGVGGSLDMVPLTHACTAESFATIRALIDALSEWQLTKAIAKAPPVQSGASEAKHRDEPLPPETGEER